SLAFRNSMSFCNSAWNPARVSWVAALGRNKAEERLLCSGKTAEESAASPSARQPKTTKRTERKASLIRCVYGGAHILGGTLLSRNRSGCVKIFFCRAKFCHLVQMRSPAHRKRVQMSRKPNAIHTMLPTALQTGECRMSKQ